MDLIRRPCMAKRISSVLLLLILFTIPSFAATLPLSTKKYERSAGKPDVFKETFPVCNTDATYNLVIQNGESGKSMASSASIIINGIELIKESEFNQKIDRIEKEITLIPENTLEVKLESIPESFITVAIQCIANCLDVDISTPTNGSTINKQKTTVKGSLYNAYGETGVMVGNTVSEGSARFSAYREGSEFAGLVPLAPGENNLTVIATDACGQKAEDTIIVNAVPTAEQMRLSVNPSSGVMSFQTGTIDVKFEADVYGTALNYAWDFDGDGTADKSGVDMSSVTFGYSQSGLYFPVVTVTDSNGNSYAETAVVNVMSKEEMDGILKGKWDGMKEGLASGDIEKALRYFHEGSKEKYREAFGVLGGDLPSIAAGMQDMTFLYARGNTAKGRVLRHQVIDGQTMTITYYTYFYLDEDGIWRIESF